MNVTKEVNRQLIFRALDRQDVPGHALRSLTNNYYRIDVADINGLYFTKYAKFSIVFKVTENPFAVEREIMKYKRLAKR